MERFGRIRRFWSGIHVSQLMQVAARVLLTVCAAWFRLFVGDLSNDVSDDVLSNAFNKYASFQKARVIRDRLSGKVSQRCACSAIWTDSVSQAKFGFVAFSDPEDFLKAWKEMDGELHVFFS